MYIWIQLYHINSSPDCKTNFIYVVRILIPTAVGVIIYKKVKLGQADIYIDIQTGVTKLSDIL